MTEAIGGNSAAQLKSIIERVERINEERDGLLADRREILAEAKSSGFDPKAINAVVRMRKQDRVEREEFEAIVEMYSRAVGI